MAFCIVVPLFNQRRPDPFSRFPIEVVYRPKNGEKVEVRFIYWEEKEVKKQLTFQGKEWLAYRFRENHSDWEKINYESDPASSGGIRGLCPQISL